MFDFPNSSAMDATASSGGPGTFLYQIVTGQPQQIQQHSTSMLSKATQFISLMDEFTNAAEQLDKVWSGQAAAIGGQEDHDIAPVVREDHQGHPERPSCSACPARS